MRADDFDDLYFDVHDGLAEANMCLPMARIFVKIVRIGSSAIAETGFGTGLNFLAVLDLLVEFPNHQIDYYPMNQGRYQPMLWRRRMPHLHRSVPIVRRCWQFAAALAGVHLRHFTDTGAVAFILWRLKIVWR